MLHRSVGDDAFRKHFLRKASRCSDRWHPERHSGHNCVFFGSVSFTVQRIVLKRGGKNIWFSFLTTLPGLLSGLSALSLRLSAAGVIRPWGRLTANAQWGEKTIKFLYDTYFLPGWAPSIPFICKMCSQCGRKCDISQEYWSLCVWRKARAGNRCKES